MESLQYRQIGRGLVDDDHVAVRMVFEARDEVLPNEAGATCNDNFADSTHGLRHPTFGA